MYEWKKLGRVFSPADVKNVSWMKEYAQSPSVIIFDNYIRVYFCCSPLPDANGQYVRYIAYVDLDRNNLLDVINISKEPVLKLGELGTFDEFGTYPVSAIRNGDEIRAYYGGFTRCESVPFNAAIGVAISNDNGETFARLGKGPVLSYSLDEPFVLGSPKIRRFGGQWYLWYVAGRKWLDDAKRPEPVYKIRMAISDNGLDWKKVRRNIIADVLDENECQASPDVFHSNGKYHMYFSYRYCLGFKTEGRGYRVGYAYSDDLLNWTRSDIDAGIDVSDEGWDSESISYSHIFEVDSNIYMLYQGNQIGRFGFGLAHLQGTL